MKKIIYRLIIFILIFGIGLTVFLVYKDFNYRETYEFDYEKDQKTETAISGADWLWLDPVKIKSSGYYVIKIRPWLDSLENQTYHILEMLDQEKNVIAHLEERLYEEVGKVSEGSPENLRNCKWDTNCKNQTFADYTKRVMVKIDQPGEYLLRYHGVKDFNNLESEEVYFSIYKKLNPYLFGFVTLFLAILGLVFIPRFLKLKSILKIFKRDHLK